MTVLSLKNRLLLVALAAAGCSQQSDPGHVDRPKSTAGARVDDGEEPDDGEDGEPDDGKACPDGELPFAGRCVKDGSVRVLLAKKTADSALSLVVKDLKKGDIVALTASAAVGAAAAGEGELVLGPKDGEALVEAPHAWAGGAAPAILTVSAVTTLKESGSVTYELTLRQAEGAAAATLTAEGTTLRALVFREVPLASLLGDAAEEEPAGWFLAKLEKTIAAEDAHVALQAEEGDLLDVTATVTVEQKGVPAGTECPALVSRTTLKANDDGVIAPELTRVIGSGVKSTNVARTGVYEVDASGEVDVALKFAADASGGCVADVPEAGAGIVVAQYRPLRKLAKAKEAWFLSEAVEARAHDVEVATHENDAQVQTIVKQTIALGEGDLVMVTAYAALTSDDDKFETLPYLQIRHGAQARNSALAKGWIGPGRMRDTVAACDAFAAPEAREEELEARVLGYNYRGRALRGTSAALVTWRFGALGAPEGEEKEAP